MRVGWLQDPSPYIGGAEQSAIEFRQAAPDDVEVVDCPPGEVDDKCDRYVIHNAVLYQLGDMDRIAGPAVKYWHDVGSHVNPLVREWLDRNAVPVCCSPVQAEYMDLTGKAKCIPPALDLERFRRAAESVNGDRKGIVSIGSWRNFGKAPHRVQKWADPLPVDFYGAGPFAPEGSVEVSYEGMPYLLAQYRTFAFLPTVIEPFGRAVAEAYAAGCELVINNLVGAKYWITENPGALDAARKDFWEAVLSA